MGGSLTGIQLPLHCMCMYKNSTWYDWNGNYFHSVHVMLMSFNAFICRSASNYTSLPFWNVGCPYDNHSLTAVWQQQFYELSLRNSILSWEHLNRIKITHLAYHRYKQK